MNDAPGRLDHERRVHHENQPQAIPIGLPQELREAYEQAWVQVVA